MTNQASEIFDLCKEVYERTGWEGTRDWIREDGLIVDYNVWETSTPLYTSDYLLEKLPEGSMVSVYEQGATYYAMVDNADKNPFDCDADTPLKALLKFTIALSEAGELNDQSS